MFLFHVEYFFNDAHMKNKALIPTQHQKHILLPSSTYIILKHFQPVYEISQSIPTYFRQNGIYEGTRIETLLYIILTHFFIPSGISTRAGALPLEQVPYHQSRCPATRAGAPSLEQVPHHLNRCPHFQSRCST